MFLTSCTRHQTSSKSLSEQPPRQQCSPYRERLRHRLFLNEEWERQIGSGTSCYFSLMCRIAMYLVGVWLARLLPRWALQLWSQICSGLGGSAWVPKDWLSSLRLTPQLYCYLDDSATLSGCQSKVLSARSSCHNFCFLSDLGLFSQSSHSQSFQEQNRPPPNSRPSDPRLSSWTWFDPSPLVFRPSYLFYSAYQCGWDLAIQDSGQTTSPISSSSFLRADTFFGHRRPTFRVGSAQLNL